MAISAIMSTYPTSVNPNSPVEVKCSVYNGESSTVTITGIRPKATIVNGTSESMSVGHGMPDMGPGMTATIASGATRVFRWKSTIHAPQGGWGMSSPTSLRYDLSAVIQTATLSCNAQPAIVKVIPLNMRSTDNSTLTFPAAVAQPVAPNTGAFEFDYYQNSAHVVLIGGCP